MRRRRIIITYTAGLLAMLCLSAAAFAGKQSSSLSLVVLSGDSARSASTTAPGPTYGGDITFDVATTQTERPFVNVRCYQGPTFVYDAWHGFFAGYYTDAVFTLASSYWSGGSANCTARLVDFGNGGRERTLATTSFAVGG
jgi:hypothetical protein